MAQQHLADCRSYSNFAQALGSHTPAFSLPATLSTKSQLAVERMYRRSLPSFVHTPLQLQVLLRCERVNSHQDHKISEVACGHPLPSVLLEMRAWAHPESSSPARPHHAHAFQTCAKCAQCTPASRHFPRVTNALRMQPTTPLSPHSLVLSSHVPNAPRRPLSPVSERI
jgi:hypothetical protein